MPDIEGILKNLNALLQLIFGKNVPGWIAPVTGWTLLIPFLLSGLWGILVLISKIKDAWTKDFLPLFYNTELKRRLLRRRRFAGYIEREILRLDENWEDDRFAELEAEIEADGRRKRSLLFPFGRQKNGLRRERSLSKAIAYSQERCIVVVGDPGSGKSVALRHVALQLASKAKRAHNVDSIIPIYVNLKDLEYLPDATIDHNLIEGFVLKSLRRINDRYVDDFLDEEFAKGIEQSTWFFLFDSFDELPAVLSSTETDNIIKQYGDAIADFLEGGMNQCRGVVASRQFRGPKHFSWPRFRILALSEERRRELIHKVDLQPKLELELIGRLGTTSDEIRSWASNPLFLALLCVHMSNGNPFPENVHTVFETYIRDRLKRDQGRLEKGFALSIGELRATAEKIAFCMTADHGLGLSPTRAKLRTAMMQQGIDVPAHLDKLLDALEYIKLARSDTEASIADERVFTFAHRRFQEYFATCVVLRDSSRVPPMQLLTDGRWRETAVVMCQMQPINDIRPLLVQAERLLASYGDSIPNLMTNSADYIQQTTKQAQQCTVERFPWPINALYLLELLQDGLAGRLHEIPAKIRMRIGQIGLTATETGTLGDRKWALEVSGIAPEPVLQYMLQNAFSEQSQWLKEVAYRQVARPQTIEPAIEDGIRLAIINMAKEGRLKRVRYSTQTHVARLPQPAASNLLSIIKLLLLLPWINLIWHAFLLLYFALSLLPYIHYVERLVVATCITFLSYRFSRSKKFRNSQVNLLVALLYLIVFYIISYILFISTPIYAIIHLASYNFFTNWQMRLILFLLMFQCVCAIKLTFNVVEHAEEAGWFLYTNIVFYPIFLLFMLFFIFIGIIWIIYKISYYLFIYPIKNHQFLYRHIFLFFTSIVPFFVKNVSLVITYIKSLTIKKEKTTESLPVIAVRIVLMTVFTAIVFLVSYFTGFDKEKIRAVKQLRRRRIRLRDEWKEMCKQPIDHYAFLYVLQAFRTTIPKGLLAIIAYTRQHQLLIPSKEAEEELRALALEIELESNARKRFSKSSYDRYMYSTSILLDELYLLIEDIHAKLPHENGF